MVAGINRVPTGGSDSASARVQIANSLNATIAQLATAQTNIATNTAALAATLGGDLTGTLPNPTVGANKVTNAKLAQMAANTIKGNNTVGTANAADLTADQTKALLGGTLAQAPAVTETTAVATGTTTMPGGDTVPTSAQGNQYLSVSITPKNASSTLIIDAQLYVSNSANVQMEAALFSGGASAIATGFADEAGTSLQLIRILHKMVAGVTTALTFTVRAGGTAAGTTTLNGKSGTRMGGGTLTSTITVTEILP